MHGVADDCTRIFCADSSAAYQYVDNHLRRFRAPLACAYCDGTIAWHVFERYRHREHGSIMVVSMVKVHINA